MQLTDERLNEIRAREQAASPGPWVFNRGVFGGGRPLVIDGMTQKADGEFVMHARQDIPDLLAEVDGLNKALLAKIVECQLLQERVTELRKANAEPESKDKQPAKPLKQTKTPRADDPR